MRALIAVLLLPLSQGIGTAQLAFDVASVKPSERIVSKDYNNQIALNPTGLTAKNATLKRLIEYAYGLRPHEVAGPAWIDTNEYDVMAEVSGSAAPAAIQLMLQALLRDRFRLSSHREPKDMRVYMLSVDKEGAKIQSSKEIPEPGRANLNPRDFRGELQQFANMLSIQLTIPPLSDDPTKPSMARGAPVPVIDNTSLQGIYEIKADVKLESGVEIFTLWQRALQPLGLRLESGRITAQAFIVDSADRTPTAN